MQGKGVRRREGAIAWTLVLAWHLLFAWMLTRASRIEPAPVPGPALQVVYLPAPPLSQSPERNPAAVQARDTTSMPARRARRRSDATNSSTTASAAIPATTGPATMQVQVLPRASLPGPTSADGFLAQARQLAEQQARAAAGPADPFARREVQLPGAGAGRFRMRRQVSAADVVNAVGGYLFAPKGYDADPCPRNRSNIGRLMTGGDSAALLEEVEFERRHCRG